MQLRTMEVELHALASSNQQLRNQLELATKQTSRSKLAAQSAADGTDQLQQEVDVLRSAADIEGEIRRELESSIEQVTGLNTADSKPAGLAHNLNCHCANCGLFETSTC